MPGRCEWADGPLAEYHDTEWGVPVHSDDALFEGLVLQGAQAGLSWLTIFKKRPAYREAFEGFSIDRVAAFDDADAVRLLLNPGIVRNRSKVHSAISNARAAQRVRDEFGSLDRFIWSFVGGEPVKNARQAMSDIPATSPESDALSAGLKQQGFRFVGPTICYALMQADGLVNDHAVYCLRYDEV